MSHPGFRGLGHASAETLLVAGQHEEQEAETVEPTADLRVVEAASELQRQAAALRPAGDRAGQVKRPRSRGGAGQDETVRHRNCFLELCGELLEAFYPGGGGGSKGHLGLRVGGELSTQGVQPTLQLLADRANA